MRCQLCLVSKCSFLSLFNFDTLKSNHRIYNIKMKVCVCVCVYVRRPAAGPTQAITPKFGMGSSFHPGSAPSQGVTPKCWPPGVPPIMIQSEKTWKVNTWVGGQQTIIAPRGGFVYKNFICGGIILTPGPQGPPCQMGVYALRIGLGPANKSCS